MAKLLYYQVYAEKIIGAVGMVLEAPRLRDWIDFQLSSLAVVPTQVVLMMSNGICD